MHLASPTVLAGGDPESIIDAAKNGTLRLLESARDHAGPQLSRFLLVSSIASLTHPNDVPANYVYTEDDWSAFTEEVVRNMGEAIRPMAYYASKPLAERIMWEFVKSSQVGR